MQCDLASERALRESSAEDIHLCQGSGGRVGCYPHYRLENLQHLIPLALVFEHDFPEETNGRHAVAEQFVMKFLQREIVALLRLVVVAQFQDLQFAKGVIQITRVKRGAHGFLAGRFLFVITIVLEKFRRFINRHILRVNLDGHT